jgi:hypothetical protein
VVKIDGDTRAAADTADALVAKARAVVPVLAAHAGSAEERSGVPAESL